jgi:hypothetical protein
MRKFLCILVLFSSILLLFIKCSQPVKSKSTFEIYIVTDKKTSDIILKTDINKLTLESKPIITEKDITDYYWKSHIFSVSSEIRQNIDKKTGVFFVVVVNGKRIYLGCFWSLAFSRIEPDTIICLWIGDSNIKFDELSKDDKSRFYFPHENLSYFKLHIDKNITDLRNSDIIYKALDADRILRK